MGAARWSVGRPQVAHMAALEGLDAHKRAVTLRLAALNDGASQ